MMQAPSLANSWAVTSAVNFGFFVDFGAIVKESTVLQEAREVQALGDDGHELETAEMEQQCLPVLCQLGFAQSKHVTLHA